MEVNEEKRNKFMENAGKRVNKVMHDIQILEPMARSSVYDFTREDVEAMFVAMQDALDTAKKEYNKKFEEKSKSERKVFSFETASQNCKCESSVTVENNMPSLNEQLSPSESVLTSTNANTEVSEEF